MRRWALPLLLACQALAAGAHTTSVSERVAPTIVDRARISAPAESPNNLLTLLTMLVGTAGALWAAIRASGGKDGAGR